MNNNLELIELSQYIKPEIEEDKKLDYIRIGKDNDFFNYLIDLYHNSPTNGSIINGIVANIYGKGLRAEDECTRLEQDKKL